MSASCSCDTNEAPSTVDPPRLLPPPPAEPSAPPDASLPAALSSAKPAAAAAILQFIHAFTLSWPRPLHPALQSFSSSSPHFSPRSCLACSEDRAQRCPPTTLCTPTCPPSDVILQGSWIPSAGQWPTEPQDDVQVSDQRIWVDGCFDFAHHGTQVAHHPSTSSN